MRIHLVLVTLFILSGCKFKEAMDNNFQTKSKINPIAPAETIAERFGNGRTNAYTLKIPLTESSIGYFDIDEVLSNEADRNRHGFFTRVKNSFKKTLFKIFLKLGFKNKMKFTTYFQIPEINPKYVESARVKKIFFTSEDCRTTEQDCDDVESRSSNFNFVDQFYVNVASEDEPASLTEEDFIQEVDGKDFKKMAERSFSQTKTSAISKVSKMAKADKTFLESNENEINILKFHNTVPYMSINTEGVTEDMRNLLFKHVEEHIGDKGRVKRYLRSKRFRHLIRRVTGVRDGVRVSLKRNAKPSELFELISEDQSPLAHKMMIFRLSGRYVEAKKYFEHKRFKSLVKDTSMIGRSLFVELYRKEDANKIVAMLNDREHYAHDHFDIYKMERCHTSNCLDLEALNINMAPLLTSGKDLRIDTYISVRTLSSVDFKYNGYIEVEVVLKNLPL